LTKKHQESEKEVSRLNSEVEKLEKELKELRMKYEKQVIENKKLKKDLEELKKNRDWHVERITEVTFQWEKCKREHAELTVIHKQLTV
jgi:peptidoglycan hydrolase CwlO-like protein